MYVEGNYLVLSDGRTFLIEGPRTQTEGTQTTQRRPLRSYFRAFLAQAKPTQNTRRETQTTQQAN